MTLYPRNPGPTQDHQKRIKAEAHRLLDQAKAGHAIARHEIEWALIQTGDWMEPVKTPIVIEHTGSWRDSKNQLDDTATTRQD